MKKFLKKNYDEINKIRKNLKQKEKENQIKMEIEKQEQETKKIQDYVEQMLILAKRYNGSYDITCIFDEIQKEDDSTTIEYKYVINILEATQNKLCVNLANTIKLHVLAKFIETSNKPQLKYLKSVEKPSNFNDMCNIYNNCLKIKKIQEQEAKKIEKNIKFDIRNLFGTVTVDVGVFLIFDEFAKICGKSSTLKLEDEFELSEIGKLNLSKLDSFKNTILSKLSQIRKITWDPEFSIIEQKSKYIFMPSDNLTKQESTLESVDNLYKKLDSYEKKFPNAELEIKCDYNTIEFDDECDLDSHILEYKFLYMYFEICGYKSTMEEFKPFVYAQKCADSSVPRLKYLRKIKKPVTFNEKVKVDKRCERIKEIQKNEYEKFRKKFLKKDMLIFYNKDLTHHLGVSSLVCEILNIIKEITGRELLPKKEFENDFKTIVKEYKDEIKSLLNKKMVSAPNYYSTPAKACII